jgi:flagellar biosynthesis protein
MTEQDKVQQEKVAVALQFDPSKDSAPRLTAKGRGPVAEKIVQVAEAAGVHVEHNQPLANSLSQLDFGQQIPKELYRAVAEVIGFVLKKTGQMSKLQEGAGQDAGARPKPEPAPRQEERSPDMTL